MGKGARKKNSLAEKNERLEGGKYRNVKK